MLVDTEDPETWLLSAVFQDEKRIHDAAAVVSPEDFSAEDKRLTFIAMLDLANSGKPIDMLHVEGRLNEMGMWKRVGWDALERFTDGSPIPERIADYGIMVREQAKRRALRSLMELCVARIESREKTADCISLTLEGIWRLMANSTKAEAKSLREIMPEVLNQMQGERTRTGELVGMSTGIHQLDQATTGVRPDEFWVVGALPGRGKTAFGLQVAVSAANNGFPAAIFSLEMTRGQIVRRYLAGNTNVGSAGIRDPQILAEQRWQEFIQEAAEISKLPLYIDDSSMLSIQELSARARLYIRRFGAKLIIVDYLRLVQSPGRELREKMANTADVLRQIAKDEHVSVMALSQLSRPGDINDRPSMISLKESGDIEAAAHVVLLLYQPIADDNQPSGEDEIIIGKQRNGPLGTIPAYFDRRTLTFREREMVAR